jgi:alpha-glucosidase
MERLPIFWEGAVRRPWFLPFYRDVIALRRGHEALRRGETLWLHNSDEARVVSYVRRVPGEEILVAVNLSSQPWAGTVEVTPRGPWREITPAVGLPIQPGGVVPERPVREMALPEVNLDAWGFRVFAR